MENELTYLQTHWWILTIRGILTILFGIACVFWPGLTLVTFVYLFGLYILVLGLISIFQGVTSISHHKTWILTLLLGVLELGVGVFLLRNPGVSFAILILLIGFSFILYGIFEVIGSLADNRATSTGKTLAIITGVLGILAGIVVFFQPEESGVAFVWIIGLFALISGPVWIAMSLDLKRLTDNVDKRRLKA